MPAQFNPARLFGIAGAAVALLLPLQTPVLADSSKSLKPSVKFTLTDGAKVSDTTTIVARATTDDDTGIDKVEFAVDDQLKATDASTPYSFDWDTLAETEGSHTITATAFDAKGRTARAKITLTIDNELGKGADAHADSALAALKEGNLPAATNYARRALKLAPGNLKAARALAGIYRERGDYGQAVAILDKATLPEDDIDTRVDLVTLHILKGDNAETTDDFLKEAVAAGEVYKKLQEIRVAKLKKEDPNARSTSISLGDAEFAAGDLTAAMREYQKAGPSDTAPVEVVNRLILANINAGKLREADTLIHQLTRAKRADEVTQTMVALMQYNEHDLVAAQKSVSKGVEEGTLASLILGSYIDLALGQRKKAQAEGERAAAIAPDLPEIHLLRSYLADDAGDQRKEAIRALQINPALTEAYVDRGVQIMLTRDAKRFESADPVLDLALKLDPKSNYALMAKSLSMISQRRPNEAEPLLTQVLDQDKNAPDAHTAKALNLSLQDKSLGISQELKLAFTKDQERWADVFVPKPTDLMARVYRYRFSPALTPAALYPPKS
jgi:tetratricopeptide (TPR) repeat protein